MRILIINPNSNPQMCSAIQETAEVFVQGRYEVACMPTPDAPDFIETYEDILRAGPGMVRLVGEQASDWDAFIIACHYDPNLDAIKEIADKPVVGMGEASMIVASMLGHRFSIITTDEHSIPLHEECARKYHLHDLLASVRAPEEGALDLSEEERIYRISQLVIEEDMAEIIVLGCAGMAGLDKQLQSRLSVPVLDGIVCALLLAEGFVRYRISTSKARRYQGR